MANVAKKRGFLVVGPESSGTKWVTRLFVRAGCHGDYWHKQRWDREVPTVSPIVYRRSYPHGGQWPNMQAILNRFDAYDMRLIMVFRALHFTVESRKRHKAGGDLQGQAVAALQTIVQQWQETGIDGVWITYESLVKYPAPTISWLFNWCDLPQPRGIKIKDGNIKYV